ncbi:MAG: hypothetical protein K2X95_00350 [Flavobacteriaceae bacterium]|nr:hypothetical protein [Flavobacteriaceae bacterium]
MNYLNYIKYGIILILVCAGIWFVKDYLDKSEFKKDTEANELANARFDSLRVKTLIFTDKQMMAALKQNDEYKALLKENNIKLNRVTSVMNHLLKYRDTTIVNTDLSSVLAAINSKENIVIPIKDSTSCLVIKGNINYQNGVLGLNITDRIFNGNTTAIGYWERRPWSFLGIKTRFLGKKQGTVKLIDKCGESRIINIEENK